ncbi:hypothetical protein OIU77_020544 [Salix suchowensis]|uniref:TF-B3 domain-containing protein n=1 Tax=Salix suchowensis TaxID=1278906 RepID=A0ABQ9C6S6_9ROSI|nr:hypothetical protein OIU77_020544 [Salix suchowensis]
MMMRIPPKFAKHLVNLPGILRGNAGILASKGNQNILYFEEGWREFVQNNALEPGDFLVFSYSGISEFDVTIYGKDGCEKNVVAATEKKTEPYSCVGKQNEVDQPVGKDQKHGTNIETIDIESDSKIESDISMTKLNDQQQPQCQKVCKEKYRDLGARKFISKHPSF